MNMRLPRTLIEPLSAKPESSSTRRSVRRTLSECLSSGDRSGLIRIGPDKGREERLDRMSSTSEDRARVARIGLGRSLDTQYFPKRKLSLIDKTLNEGTIF